MKPTHRIALVLPKGHEYAARLIEGIIGFAQDRSGLEFTEVPYSEGRAPSAIYEIRVDGALVWAHRDNPWVMDLRQRGVKLVSLNSEWLDQDIASVGFDIEATLDAAVDHLARLDRSGAGYVGHMFLHNPIKLQLRDGFLARAAQRGWQAVDLEVPGIPYEERHRLTEPESETKLIEFLRTLRKPASVFCDDDYVGVLVCRVAEHMGLSVPSDIAVLGMFDLSVARFSTPSLSSIPLPGQLVGAAGMQLLVELLADAPPTNNPLRISAPPVVERESTGGVIIRDDDVQRAYRMIQQLACEGLTVGQLLERFAISQKTLNKRFVAVYGHTPGREICRVRAERARQWLATTGLSIARVAAMCGFGEPSNFNLFFKRETGITPGAFRRQHRQSATDAQ